MFEAQVAYYVNEYLGQYVEGIDHNSLTISIYEGNVVLKNLQLKPSALADLDLPVTVKAGLLGSLTLNVPWSSLGRVPVEVVIDQLFILVSPRSETAGGTSPSGEKLTIAALQAAFQRAKLERVARQEKLWDRELRSLEQNKEAKGSSHSGGDGDGGGGGGGGFLRGFIDTIIGNLQFSISNVHVRYEDAETHPGHPFACGFTLERMSGSTVDEEGRAAFVTTSPLDLLRKALQLRRIAAYFDCDVPGWDPGTDWRQLPPQGWGQWFQPGISSDPSNEADVAAAAGNDAKNRQYVLQPVDGRALYTRRGRNVPRSEEVAASEVDVALDAVAVALSQAQYHSYSLLLAEVSVFTARLPHSGYRPPMRPAEGSAARVWWRYAGLAVRQQMESRRLNWQQVIKFVGMRKRYVPLYMQYLRQKGTTAGSKTKKQKTKRLTSGGGGGGSQAGSRSVSESEDGGDDEGERAAAAAADSIADTTGLPKEILEMDTGLPECTILMFRRLAYTELQRERRREEKAAAAAGKAAKAQAGSGGGGGGWLGWLMGSSGGDGGGSSGGKTAAGAEGELVVPPATGDEVGKQRAELSSEEYAKLIELVSQQEEGLKLGIETPTTLLTKIGVKVGLASAILRGPESEVVLRGSLEGIGVGIDSYPVTNRFQLEVTAMGVESPEGVFIQTGAEPTPLGVGSSTTASTATMSRATSLVTERQNLSADRALHVTFVQRPQDHSADAVLDVVLTPSYVYYTAATVERVVAFFAPPDELRTLDFSGLSSVAASQLERARRRAAEYAAAALSNKPRLRMKLDLDAPKVAIPIKDSMGQVSLALDLGRFIIESDHATAASLSPEEAGVYECIKMCGSNVSAYLVDGAFDWAALEPGNGTSSSGERGEPAPCTLIPLLERCGMNIGLQAARYPEPRYPRLRLAPVVPVLRFHFSPGRIGRLLRVINGAVPQTTAGHGASGDMEGGLQGEEGAVGTALWRAHADREGPVKVLGWTGIGRSSATWAPRHAVLYQGKMYLYEGKGASEKLIDTCSITPDRIVVRVPEDHIGGCPHVLAIRPAEAAGEDLKRVAEDASSTVLRVDSESAATEWYRALQASQQELGAGMQRADWDASTSATVSSSDVEESQHPGVMQSSEAQEQPGEAPRTLLQVDAQLGEFAIFGSGREPKAWWPPTGPDATTRDESAASPEDLSSVRVDEEVELVIVRASGGSLSFAYGAFGMDIHTVLSSLEIQDLLVGRQNSGNCFLATSSKPGTGAVEVGEDVFFDPGASSELHRMLSSGSFGGKSSPSGGASPTAQRTGEGSQHAKRDLAEFTLTLRRPGTKEYEGVDTSLDVKLGTLYFFCNRPTVAALITMGLDVSEASSAAFTGGAGQADASMPSSPAQTSPAALKDLALAADEGAMSASAATVSEEPLEGLQLSADAPGRKMFAMSVTLCTLQVVLNYEGAGEDALAESCMNDFSFELSIEPDGGMQITSALGNITAIDRTLPLESPHRQACGLRPGSSASLVALTFTLHPATHSDPRVPAGFNFYTLQAKLSELQIVFLYRFLMENVNYITTMLAMRLPPSLGPQLEPILQGTPYASASKRELESNSNALTHAPLQTPAGNDIADLKPQAETTQPLQPFILVMDVDMSAPVISLPRSSHSADAISVDLGTLRLHSHLEGIEKESSSLIEVADLIFSGVECSVVQAGVKGSTLVQNPEQGWQLGWRRPLSPETRGDQPYFDLALHVPSIKASLSDSEYLSMTSVASSNIAELPTLPPGAQWIAEQHAIEPEKEGSVSSASALDTTTPPLSPTGAALLRSLSPRALKQGDVDAAMAEAAISAVPTPDAQRTRIRTVVSLGEVELELKQTVEGLPRPVPLARFVVGDLYVAYRNEEGGAMHAQVCIPRVEVEDLRPEVPPEQSLVISSGHKASFLMLEWHASEGMASQSLGITLQKPLLVAELGFLLSVTQFVMPTFSFVKSTPLPFASMDLLLTSEAHKAEGDLWLSPSVRLLADSPGAETFEYDGGGHRLILPARDHFDELLPLIIIGSSSTLRLRNVTVVNADSLAACIQLAAGARLLAQPQDGVKLITASEASKLAMSPRKSHVATIGSPSFRGGGASEELEMLSSGAIPSIEEPEAPTKSSLSISLDAVGVGLHLMQLETPARTRSGSIASRSSSALLEGALSRSSSKHPSGSDLIAEQSVPEKVAVVTPRPRSIRMLAATMDVVATYENYGLNQKGRVEIQGLRMETRAVLDADKLLAGREGRDQAGHRKVKGKKESDVLHPCRLVLDFNLLSAQVPGEETAQVIRTDLSIEASDLQLSLSPGTFELGLELGSAALAPLMQPGVDAALRGCSQFEQVWSFDPSAQWQEDSELAVSLAATGIGAGVTVWRPKAATGYGMTGHVITPGDERPSFEVLTVAINSGIAAYPASYSLIWSGAGASIWRPVPAEGYTAVGDVVTLGSEEPELSAVLCLHDGTLVEVPVGECLPLPPALPQSPAMAARIAGTAPPVELWCVDNTMGTFLARMPNSTAEVYGRDLRSPLGVTPAGLIASGAAIQSTSIAPVAAQQRVGGGGGSGMTAKTALLPQSTPSTGHTVAPKLQMTSSPRKLYHRFQAARRQKRSEGVRRTVTPAIVDFRRIWSDGGAFSDGQGLSAWRPVAPPGYSALGDCIMKGFDPPPSALVVLDSGTSSETGLGQAKGMPLAKAPRGFDLVWHDGNPKEEMRACFWRPVPHPGYVAMGCVATIGSVPPKRGIKCLRADAAAPSPAPRAPIWAVGKADKTVPPLSLWAVDETLCTFEVEASERMAPPAERWRIRMPEPVTELSTQQLHHAEAEAQGVNIVVRAGSLSFLLLDSLNTPLLEIETSGVEAGVRGPSRQVVQAYLGLRPAIFALNRTLHHWEPVLEPVDLIAKCDANLGSKAASGIEPGIALSIKSSAEMVYTTLALAHANALLSALAELRVLHGETYARHLAAILRPDASGVNTLIVNALGVEAAMELDYGQHLEVVSLPVGCEQPVIRPISQAPLRREAQLLPRESVPHDLILLDVDTIEGVSLQGRSVYCAARLEGAGIDGKPPPGAGMPSGRRTRAVKASSEGTTGTTAPAIISWHERLVVPLPSRPGREHTLVFEIWDADSAGGKGRLIGSSSVAVHVEALNERDPQNIVVEITGKEENKSAVCTLRGSYMLQRPWHQAAVGAGDGVQKDTWAAPESTKGTRALSLNTDKGIWAVIPKFGRQKLTSVAMESAAETGKALLSSVIPLRVGSQEVVLESILKGGELSEVLRAPCQVVNSTDFALEVCLVAVGEAPQKALGTAEAGAAFPLPLTWRDPGQLLVIRPVGNGSRHSWSLDSTDNGVPFMLNDAKEGQTGLVRCPSAATTPSHQRADLWFSLSLESEMLTVGEQGNALKDWRVVVSPPLSIANQLPIPGSLMIWEHGGHGSGDREAVERLTARVPSGGRLKVHTADMRRRISFTMYPEGYDWAEKYPAVLSTGLSSSGDGTGGVRAGSGSGGGVLPPPDRARIVRPGSRLPVEVFIQRDVQLGKWLLDAREELDPGDVVARGVPLGVTLLAPLWVVNATGLAIDAAVVQVPPPALEKKQGKRKAQLAQGGGTSSVDSLRVLRTSDIPIHGISSTQDPGGCRTIAPSSLELLSYPLPSFVPTGGSAETASQRQHYGVRLRVAGSGWTIPLALDVVEVAGSSSTASTSVGNLQNAQPVLIRAESRNYGCVFEVTARLQVASFKNSQVLRLEPHIVITNRTAVPLQLLQCRAAAQAPLAAAAAGVVVVPEGSVSFTYGGVSKGNTAQPLATGQGPQLLRLSMRGAGSSPRRPQRLPRAETDAEEDSLWVADDRRISAAASAFAAAEEDDTASSVSSASSSQIWMPAVSSLSARSLVQLSGNSQRDHEAGGAVLELPAGATAVPLHLVLGLQRLMLCFRCSPSDGQQGLALWSRPLYVPKDREEHHYVVIPVVGLQGATGAHAAGGLGSEGVALLRLTMHGRGPGMLHIVLETVNAEPPFLLENRTPYPLQYRQSRINSAPFHSLEPLSAIGYTWEYSVSGTAAPELEIQEGVGIGSAEHYQLEAPEAGDSSGSGARCRPLPLSVSPHQCTVRIGFVESVVTNPEGVVAIAGDATGGALGRGGIDRVLQISSGRDPLLLAGLKGLAAPPPDFHAAFELPGLEISLVDDTPQEVLLITISELKISLATGLTPVGPYRSARCSVRRIQGDNQLPAARFPVALSLAKNAKAMLPQLSFTAVTQVAGIRGRTFFPYIGARCPDDLQVAIVESLAWRLSSMAQSVLERASYGADARPATAAADIPVRLRLLSVPDVGLNVSFLGEPLSRPRHLAGGMVSLIIDLANFQAAPVTLRGLDMSNVSTSRSAFFNQIFQIVQGELFGITLSLVRNFGVMGGASKVLGILSAGMAKLAGDKKGSTTASASASMGAPPPAAAGGNSSGVSGPSSSMQQTQSQNVQRNITDVGDGLLEGAGAFGNSVLRGIRGLVEKPMQGARTSGVEGAFKGMAKGLVGVVATPMSGALDALSATAEGFDATFGKNKEALLVLERRRLPRVIGGDGKLQPLLRDGSIREAVVEQLGQALLRATLLTDGIQAAAFRAGILQLEAYEEHFVLPADAVVLLTNCSMMLVFAPGFAQLDGAAEIGALSTAEVAPGKVIWRVRWEDMLALELRWSTPGKYPDRIVVHRRGIPGVIEEEPLAHLLSCFPETPQASQVKLVAGKVLRRYYQDPARKDQQWSEWHAARAELPADQPPHLLPLTLPCLRFEPTWNTNPNRPPVVHFWRPIAPRGYKPVGDVATLGDEAPLMPVPVFRDDVTLQSARVLPTLLDTREPSPSARPPTAAPEDYTLIWRYNGPRAVTMWMPVAPEGYVALGAIVMQGTNVPSVDDYVCIREDLTRSTSVFDSPIWAYDPSPAIAQAEAAAAHRQGGGGGAGGSALSLQQSHQPNAWKVAVWQADSRMQTFIVVRGLNKPPNDLPRSVVEVEERQRGFVAA